MQVGDGDTFLLRTRDRTYRVHVAGVDAPEADQAFGSRARKLLADMIFRRTVSVAPEEWHDDGSVSGNVQFEDHDIGQTLVEHGIAWAIRDDSRLRAHRLLELETQAREARLGLWASDLRVAPWHWRNGQRN